MINATPTPIDGQEAGPRSHSMHPLPLNQQTTRTQPRPSSLPHLRVQRRQSCERGEDNDGNVLQHSLFYDLRKITLISR